MVSTTTRVQIDTYPGGAVSVRRVLPSDPGVDVPADLLAAYRAAGAGLDHAKAALLHAAGYHLDADGDWTAPR